jgi:formylmethanofuran dehydrogenase subunit A
MLKGLELEDALSKVSVFIKDGVKCVENGVVLEAEPVVKKTYWVNSSVPDTKQVIHDVSEKFLKYYSVNLANYEVVDHYAPNQEIVEV